MFKNNSRERGVSLVLLDEVQPKVLPPLRRQAGRLFDSRASLGRSGPALFHVATVVGCSLLILAILAAPAIAKEKDQSEKTVDSGSFGVFNGGRRVASEAFTITQGATGSVVTS